MSKTCVGIDIGSNAMKLAVCTDGVVKRAETVDVPDNLVRDGRPVSPEAAADFINSSARELRINAKDCAVVLPSSVAFTRTLALPAMSHEHVLLNLPYEFRDFITQEKDKYFFDYAVLDREDNESGEPKQFDLIAAATLKETIAEYTDICRRAGFKLITAIPEEIAYMNIINRQGTEKSSDVREYGFVDLGHSVTKLHIFKGARHQATRVIDYGVSKLDSVIAELHNVDEHIARAYKHANNNGELELDAAQRIYSSIALELVRALNFHSFNVPDSKLDDLYICGGGAGIAALCDRIRGELPLEVHSLKELLDVSREAEGAISVCQLAVGAALQ